MSYCAEIFTMLFAFFVTEMYKEITQYLKLSGVRELKLMIEFLLC